MPFLGCRSPEHRSQSATCATELQKLKTSERADNVKEAAVADLAAGEWRLRWRYGPLLGYPLEAALLLYAERDGRSVELHRPEDAQKLPGFRLVNPNDALQFVRLFTSRETYYRFLEPRAYEFPSGCAKVIAEEGGFTIDRSLLYTTEFPALSLELSREDAYPLYAVRESVSSEGKYACKKVRLLQWIPKSAADMPLLE